MIAVQHGLSTAEQSGSQDVQQKHVSRPPPRLLRGYAGSGAPPGWSGRPNEGRCDTSLAHNQARLTFPCTATPPRPGSCTHLTRASSGWWGRGSTQWCSRTPWTCWSGRWGRDDVIMMSLGVHQACDSRVCLVVCGGQRDSQPGMFPGLSSSLPSPARVARRGWGLLKKPGVVPHGPPSAACAVFHAPFIREHPPPSPQASPVPLLGVPSLSLSSPAHKAGRHGRPT
jgi:hypothetical protein